MNYGEIRIRATGDVMPEYQYRIGFPHMSFAVDRAPPGTDRVVETPPPAVTAQQRAVRAGVELVDGMWRYAWTIVPARG